MSLVVHQVIGGAGPYDAITNQALRFRKLFDRWGWGGVDAAVHIDPRMGQKFVPMRSLVPHPDEVIFTQYSAYTPGLRDMLEAHGRSLVLCQNITPPEWFWQYDPLTALQCFLGRRDAARVMAAATVPAGASRYTAEEFGADTVIPILFEPERYGAPGPPRETPADGGEILFVGRLCPHKRHDALVRAVALLRARHRPNATLRIIGEPVNDHYGAQVRELGERLLGKDAFVWERGITQEDLADRYRSADALCCMSEHEGFCVPILEAFHFGLPVVGRPSGGVAEVAGDAALLTDDEDLGVVAALLDAVLGDAELRGELLERGRRRLVAYDETTTAQALRDAIERVVAT
ncbi:glycosyltransferase [Patulibacter minatonensis]|uniref:glycosyltransferase n=1 Tax=Patulibacter minatonensis TaxID=298163 RepID=UPI00047BAA06|nr:glycosyltransferase [Patulibacter minatonensis]